MTTITPKYDRLPVYQGQRILLDFEFRLLGVPTDPTIIQVITHNPKTLARIVLTYPAQELTRVNVGTYEAAIQVDDPGQWTFRIEGTGVVDAVTEIYLDVLASRV